MINNLRKNFTQIPNDLINDKSIDPKARFLFVYMASKPDGWKFYRKEVEDGCGFGMHTRIKYTKELEDKGWISIKQNKSKKGRFESNDITLHERPCYKKCNTEPCYTFSDTDNFRHGESVTLSNTDTNSNTNIDSNKNILLSEVSPSEVKNLELNESYHKVTKAFYDLFCKYSVKITGKTNKRLREAKFLGWYEDTRLLIEIDKNTIDELRDVYNFLNNSTNDFWISTISSMNGVRKNFDKLLVDAKKEKEKVAPKEKEKLVYKGILSNVNRNQQNK